MAVYGIDSVWQAAEAISTGDVVVLDTTTYARGIKKAVSGQTNIIGISQIAIASGATGQIRVFGEGVVNVGSNIVNAGDLLMASTTTGIACTATGVTYYGQVCGMALESGTGLKKVMIFHI
jgi:hypothetical protein